MGVLQRGRECGTLEAGKLADLCLWQVERPAELAYAMGANPLRARWFSGSRQAPPAGTSAAAA